MRNTYILVIASVLIVLVGFFTIISPTGLLIGETFIVPGGPSGKSSEIPQLSLEGYTEANVDVASNVMFFTSDCYRITMTTTDFQTDSIEKGKDNIREFRPVAHDLIEDILDTFDMEVMMVKIVSFEDDVYFSKVLIKQGNKILNLDARPSDAIGIAVRVDAPIYIKEDLIKNQNNYIC